MKKFICGLLTVLLIILFSTLIFSLNFKSVIVNTISSTVVKKEVASSINDIIMDIYDTNDILVLETIEEKVNNSEVVDDITEKYFDQFIDYINNDNNEINMIDIDSDIDRLIDENKDALKGYGIEITEEDKKEIVDSFDLDNQINDELDDVIVTLKSDMSSEELLVLDIYNFITSFVFQMGVIIGIFVVILLIGLIKKSFYKWFFNVGIALCCVGLINVIFMPILVNYFLSLLTLDVSINISGLVTSGYIVLVIGILLIIIYLFLHKLLKK